jgi:hypothetical protein
LDLIEHFFETKLKNGIFYPRKIELPRDNSFCLFGARGVGKSSLIIDFLNMQSREYLYIDAQDPIFALESINIEKLESFIEQERIEILVIDHYFNGFLESFPEIRQLILVSREPIRDSNMESLNLLPLDYEEFLGFDKTLSTSVAFNHFIKLGTLPKVARNSPHSYQLKLKESLFEKFNEMEIRLLSIIAKFHSKRVSTYQIYTVAREYFKISKDWTYRTIKMFQREQIVYIFDEVEAKGAKKIVLFDFVLAKYLNKNIIFFQIFDSMVSLALTKHRFRFLTFKNIGYYISERKRVVVLAPFETKEQFIRRAESIITDLERLKVESVAVVTITNRYSFDLGEVTFEALPFFEWSILNE